MIGKIGAKRTMILLFLGLVALGLGLANQFLLGPKVLESKQKLDSTNAEVSTTQENIAKMKAAFVLFQEQKDLYEKIKRIGFFSNQDRTLARERFKTIQKLSKVISAQYQIQSAKVIASDNPENTDYVVLESPMEITLSAIDDLDIFRFIYYLNYGFSGHITIESLTMARSVEVTADILKQIGTGSPPPIVSANMKVTWRTMVNKKEILPEESASSPAAPQGVTP